MLKTIDTLLKVLIMRKAKQVTYPLMDYGMPRLPSFSLIVLLMLNGVAEHMDPLVL